ncbi:hypothetical protein PIB30_054158 [Stylosanthes scabra]|uniref:Uncharacterized protein n=1 Tax=Stylosanthes scabra TaxID=79078 RepID=A0ABU6RIZ9_9FABA|nr:hypothetical protein [Stylosanthes scabra]
MAEETQSTDYELPAFDGIGSGYGWSILAQQFWNARGVSKTQRLLDVSGFFTGRSSIWFRLWSLRNPNADWDTFDLVFLHQFQPDMRPILPEIHWKEVEDWEIEATIEVSNQRKSRFRCNKQFSNKFNNRNSRKKEEAKEKGATWNATTNSTTTTAQEQKLQESTLAKSLKDNLCSYHEEVDLQELIDPKLQSIQQQDEVKEQCATLLDVEKSDDGTTLGNGVTQHMASSAAVNTVTRAKEEESHRQPPKPPNLSLEGMVGNEATDLCLATMPAVSLCKTANVAAARGSVGDKLTDLNKGTDVTAKGMRKMSSVQAATMRLEDGVPTGLNGGFQIQGFRRIVHPFVGKPQSLFAATFPWDRDSDIATTVVPPRNQDTNNSATTNKPRLRDQWRGGDEYGSGGRPLQENENDFY